MPARIVSSGERTRTVRPWTAISPDSRGRAPKIESISSVRPAPASPAKASTSPARASNVMSRRTIRA